MPKPKAVHCPTQEDYDTLMEAYEKKGWVFSSEAVGMWANWIFNKENTCVPFHDYTYVTSKESLSKSSYQIITLNEALKELHMPEYKRGDRVLVWNYADDDKEEQIYVTTIEGSDCPFVCVYPFNKVDFEKGRTFSVQLWKHISPLPQKKTVDDVLSKLSDEDKEIIKEALK